MKGIRAQAATWLGAEASGTLREPALRIHTRD
jgi:hypothetical protein